jgi:hypothetical protein
MPKRQTAGLDTVVIAFPEQRRHHRERSSQKTFDFRARTIAPTNPNDFGRRSKQYTSLLKIRVFRNDGETVRLGIIMSSALPSPH